MTDFPTILLDGFDRLPADEQHRLLYPEHVASPQDVPRERLAGDTSATESSRD